LLMRHHFRVTELYTAYDRPPTSYKQRLKFALGIPVFKLFPERGGTLLMVTKRESCEMPLRQTFIDPARGEGLATQ
jgi:hypothetical protein